MTRCLLCGFESDDVAEGAAHAISHTQHKRRCDCGPCQVVFGDSGRSQRGYHPRLDQVAYDIWLEGNAA